MPTTCIVFISGSSSRCGPGAKQYSNLPRSFRFHFQVVWSEVFVKSLHVLLFGVSSTVQIDARCEDIKFDTEL